LAGRGPQTFKKRQKEQQRKEKQQLKMEKKAQRKESGEPGLPEIEPLEIDVDEAAEQEALLRLGLSE
jgi:hypothetical protein